MTINVVNQSKLKHVEFTLATGDLFAARVDAIVSSEQTDFVLSLNPRSISGQIRTRYGEAVQQELDAITNQQVLGPGTVIDTSGGKDFKRIFHAGFHDPSDWPDRLNDVADHEGNPRPLSEFRETDYFAAIGSCISQILDNAVAQRLKSVAFPLIGCGVFGLNEKMLILQFLNALEEFDERWPDIEKPNVWLVIRNSSIESIAGVFLNMLVQERRNMVSVRLKRSGVPILDRFAARLSERTNEDWAKWQLCRFAEIAVSFMCFGLTRSANPMSTPESLLEEDKAFTFGKARELAHHLATSSTLNPVAWGARSFAQILQDAKCAKALEAVNAQRNALAHGRESLPLTTIKNLVLQGIQLDAWERIEDSDGYLRLVDWQPWVALSLSGTNQIGLFERWRKNALRYVVPETGQIFKAPRSVTVRGDRRSGDTATGGSATT